MTNESKAAAWWVFTTLCCAFTFCMVLLANGRSFVLAVGGSLAFIAVSLGVIAIGRRKVAYHGQIYAGLREILAEGSETHTRQGSKRPD